MPKYLNDVGVGTLKEVVDTSVAVSLQPISDAITSIESNYVRNFETVAEMQATTDLQVGMTCHTNGFHSAGDGGAAYYTIGTSGDIMLQDGLYATYVSGTRNQTKMLVIGDSFSDYEYSGDQNSDSSLWWYKVAQTLDLAPTKYAKSGAGFVRPSDSITLSTLLNDAISDITDKETYKYVMVMGGLNDIAQTVDAGAPSTPSAFKTAVESFVINAHAAFPNSVLVMIGCNTFIDNQRNSTSGLDQYIASKIIKSACFAAPAVYVDTSKSLLGHSSQFNASSHPNAYGETRLAGEVLNGILGRGTNINNPATYNDNFGNMGLPTFTPNTDNGVSSITPTFYTAYFTNKSYHLNFVLSIKRTYAGVTGNALGTMNLPHGLAIAKKSTEILLCSGYRSQGANQPNYAYINNNNYTLTLTDQNNTFTSGKYTYLVWFSIDIECIV